MQPPCNVPGACLTATHQLVRGAEGQEYHAGMAAGEEQECLYLIQVEGNSSGLGPSPSEHGSGASREWIWPDRPAFGQPRQALGARRDEDAAHAIELGNKVGQKRLRLGR